VVITFVVEVIALPEGGYVLNTADLYPPEGDVISSEEVSVPVVEEELVTSVALNKTATPTGLPGSAITYTITVINDGDVPLTGLVVTDRIPSQLENPRSLLLPPGARGGFNAEGTLLRVTLDPLAPVDRVVITFVATISEDVSVGTRIVNFAIVDNAVVYDTARALTTVDDEEPDASVSLTKTAPQTGSPGDPITYTITVRNTGNVTLEGLEVTDNLPSDLENPRNLVVLPAAGATGGFNPAGTELRLTLEPLAPRESVVITFVATISEDARLGTMIENEARVEHPYLETVYDEDSATTLIGNPRVSLTKTAPQTGSPGDTITYTITVRNTGNVTLEGLEVTDSLPSELENPRNLVILPAAGATGGFNPAGTELRLTLGSLAPGQSVVITFVATISEGARLGTTIENDARVEHPEFDTVYDEDSATTLIGDPSVSLTKVASPVSSPGDMITYTITVTNTGNVTLTGLVVRDDIPAELRNPRNLVLPAGATGGFNTAGTVLVVNLAPLNPGASVVITFVATISEDVRPSTIIVNNARVEHPELDTVYAVASATTRVVDRTTWTTTAPTTTAPTTTAPTTTAPTTTTAPPSCTCPSRCTCPTRCTCPSTCTCQTAPDPSQPKEPSEPVAPPSQPGETAPPKQPGDAAPPQQPGDAAPPKQPGEATPPKQPEETTPPSQPGATTPPSQPGATTPPSQPGESTPDLPSAGAVAGNLALPALGLTALGTVIAVAKKSKKD